MHDINREDACKVVCKWVQMLGYACVRVHVRLKKVWVGKRVWDSGNNVWLCGMRVIFNFRQQRTQKIEPVANWIKFCPKMIRPKRYKGHPKRNIFWPKQNIWMRQKSIFVASLTILARETAWELQVLLTRVQISEVSGLCWISPTCGCTSGRVSPVTKASTSGDMTIFWRVTGDNFKAR